jgi:tetratricopeptide (TPR) repeat protein
MRISWLSAAEIAAAREALTANGATWDDHFSPEFAIPAAPPESAGLLDWAGITEHVARAERVSEVVRAQGLDAARARFGDTGIAIEAATLAAAAHEGEVLELDQVLGVLRCSIDSYVFYAPFLELVVALGQGLGRGDVAVQAYEEFVAAYARALAELPQGAERIGAVRDGLADLYVSAGRLEDAEALFERRHEEDQADVAVALSASRAFLAAGAISRAVHWLGIGAVRAAGLGRGELAERLRQKQETVRKRLS